MIGRRVAATVAAAVLTGALVTAGPGAASASTPGVNLPAATEPAATELVPHVGNLRVQAQVAHFLVEHPDAEPVAANQVSWDGGDVVMTFPTKSVDLAAPDLAAQDETAQGATLATQCAAGWSCLFEHSGYGGRKLQFRSCGYTQSLGAYGFANTASSWINSRGAWTRVFDGSTTLWTEYGYASVPNVGAANDRADSIHLYC